MEKSVGDSEQSQDDSVVSNISDSFSNERVLTVLNRLTGVSPYSHEFVPDGEDPQMLSGFISAMGNFMGEVTGTEEVQWKTVYGADSSILVEGGDWVLGVLAVGRETAESRSKLRRIIVEFEESFSYLRDAIAFEGGIYDEFDKFVRRVFVDSKISNRSLLMNPSMWHEELIQAGGQDLGGSRLSELDSITVEEIAKLLQKPLDETSDIISKIAWTTRLPISFVPPDNEILALSEGSSSILFSRNSSMKLNPSTLMVIGALDGRTTLASVMNSVSAKNRGLVLTELGSLDNSGYIQRISLERRLVLLNECILSELIESCIRELGPWKGKQYILWAINAVIKQDPWVARLRLTKAHRVLLVLDDYIGPLQLEEISRTMDKVVDLIGIYLTRDKGQAIAHRIVTDAKRRCNRKWSEYLTNIDL